MPIFKARGKYHPPKKMVPIWIGLLRVLPIFSTQVGKLTRVYVKNRDHPQSQVPEKKITVHRYGL